MKKATSLVISITLTLIAVPVGFAHQDIDDGATRYRHQTMKAAAAHRKAISEALAVGAPYRSQALAHAKALTEFFASIPAMFPEKGDYSESDASPEIWKRWKDFVRQSGEGELIAAAMVTAADNQDWAAVESHLLKLGKACKSCHDLYRE